MAVHIIVDGYNLIRRSNIFREFEAQSLEDGRAALLEDLRRYKKMTGHAITVVFDAAERKGSASGAGTERGIKVVYSALGQTADQVILQMARRDRDRAVIVTSDVSLAKGCESLGATSISSNEFEERLMLAFSGKFEDGGDEDEDTGGGSLTAKKGPSKRLSRSERKKRGKLSKL